MDKFILSGSILSADFRKLEEEINTAIEAGMDWVHVDVMDGSFVPNISMGPFIVETCKKITDIPINVHLMIDEPEKHIDSFASAGADNLTIHIENNPNVYRTLGAIQSLGCTTGITLNPGTPAAAIQAVLPLVDLVLLMSVNPGFSGQKFIPHTVKKVIEVKDMITSINSHAVIQVDGGLNADTLPAIYQAGARNIVAATAIFKHPQGIAAGIRALRDSVA
ncbi:MAG: ribulose-phosphate 3-epimerase [Anaerolineaceae bacterium]|jgi:ribulose-phosphate 3-epimerase|nr:ribulose-phosphate 3-epimerase [Anaerolineaceae bacterium]